MTTPAESLLDRTTLSRPMRRLLWTIAQHKYGWCYVPPSFGERRLTSAEALERRGLVTLDRERWIAAATDAGRAVIAELFPVSPFVLRTYDHQPGGWTPLDDGCANGPDEFGNWPCDPKVIYGDEAAECQVCGRVAAWKPESDRA